MTSDVVVHKDECRIELWRSALIGNDLDAEPKIVVSVLIKERHRVHIGRRDCGEHFLDGHGFEGWRAFRLRRRRRDPRC